MKDARVHYRSMLQGIVRQLLLIWWTTCVVMAADPTATADVVISEFLADNNNGAKDDDGTRQDWIELYNAGPLAADLEGWFLTDDAANLTKWRIPAVVLQANDWLLIWASSKNRANPAAPLHTNFKISKNAGGYLALVDPGTNVVSSFSNYAAQSSDISYGRDQVDPNQSGYLSPPTPGAANVRSGSGFLGAPVASMASGVYTNASITLTLTNTNGLGTIRYTTDATAPTTNSTIYSSALVLTNTQGTFRLRTFITQRSQSIGRTQRWAGIAMCRISGRSSVFRCSGMHACA